MNKPKQKAIKAAYGEYYETLKAVITENGWVSFYEDTGRVRGIFHKNKNIETSPNHNNNWRPKSLSGIENNNGWISVSSPKELPLIDFLTKYWLFNGVEVWVETITLAHRTGVEKVTHYQPITEPKKPIY